MKEASKFLLFCDILVDTGNKVFGFNSNLLYISNNEETIIHNIKHIDEVVKWLYVIKCEDEYNVYIIDSYNNSVIECKDKKLLYYIAETINSWCYNDIDKRIKSFNKNYDTVYNNTIYCQIHKEYSDSLESISIYYGNFRINSIYNNKKLEIPFCMLNSFKYTYVLNQDIRVVSTDTRIDLYNPFSIKDIYFRDKKVYTANRVDIVVSSNIKTILDCYKQGGKHSRISISNNGELKKIV